MHLLVLDTETGGLDPATDALLEIGALLVDRSLEKVGEFDLLVRPWPGLRVLKESLDINGLNPAELESCGAREDEALGRLKDFLARPLAQGPVILAGWNISFDQMFLQAAFKRHRMDWPLGHRTLDIQSVWAFCHGWDFSGLTSACQALFGSVVPRHRALSDAQVTLDVLKKCSPPSPGS
ncbi:MAG: 3'-5' exonuclease [Dehalococcoidia bacterium]|nr:3'-5' exonuclease [Dehalococcoidia bacterium]